MTDQDQHTDSELDARTDAWLDRAFTAASSDADSWLSSSADAFSNRVQAAIAVESAPVPAPGQSRLRVLLLGTAVALAAAVAYQLTPASELSLLISDLLSGWGDQLAGSLPALPGAEATPIRNWLTSLPPLLLVPAAACAAWLMNTVAE